MSAVTGDSAAAGWTRRRAGGGDLHGVRSVVRAERRKLLAQMSTRLLAVLCVAGPFAFAGVLKIQSGAPSDALFGIWVHASGFAVALVVLGFAGSWGLPLMAGVLCGDMFSAEDRYGTWKTILTRSCTRGELFVGKVIAAMAFASALTLLATLASLAAGLVFVGDQPLVGLSGQVLSSGHSLALVALSWVTCLLPVLAYTSLAILFSVATRNGIVGVLGPSLVALLTQLLALVGHGVWVHLLLVGSAFDGWHGLLVAPAFAGPLVVSLLVSVVWSVVSLAIAWRLLVRRDFVAGVGGESRPGWLAPVRTVAIAIVVIALLAVAGNLGPTGVTKARLTSAMTSEFNAITLLQQRELGRLSPPGARFDIKPNCFKHAGPSTGPGDWTCMMTVFIPQPGKVPYSETPVSYDVSVAANGCYKAQSPPAFVGQQTMTDSHGASVTNPLFIVYGCFDIL